MVQTLYVSDFLPWHGHVFQELKDGVWQVLQSAKVDTLVLPELLVRHVSVVFDDLSEDIGWHCGFFTFGPGHIALRFAWHSLEPTSVGGAPGTLNASRSRILRAPGIGHSASI